MFRLRAGMKGKILCTDKVIEMIRDVGCSTVFSEHSLHWQGVCYYCGGCSTLFRSGFALTKNMCSECGATFQNRLEFDLQPVL
jgi:hypothetical protein